MAKPLSSSLSVTFWGAARTVTGSMHLVETNGHKILLDCGLYQGKRSEARQRNSTFPFRPGDIHAVVLSHAHIDHCGNLPNLVRQGFRGPIYCTPATLDLTAVMLADSAKIQEEDAEYLNRERPKGEPLIEPLYRREDAHRTASLGQSIPYDREQEIAPGLQVRFVDAGHLLGSAIVALKIQAGGQKHTITFTGDLGRRGLPILRDPAPVPPAELLISESTYGGRTHPPVESLADELAQVVKRTFDRGGKVLIPAFSLGRTQTVVYYLHQLIQSGRLSQVAIFVDSPLASDATEVFKLHPECFDEETSRLLEEEPDVFGQRLVHYTRTVEESKQLNGRKEPCIIIAASGMCETGRILHHLKHNIENPANTVLIIGYQAPDTVGYRLVNKEPEIRIHEGLWKLRAEVVVMNGFSSHADRGDFMDYLGPLAGQVQHVRLVHGEVDQAEALANSLREKGFKEVGIPDRGEGIRIVEKRFSSQDSSR
jgi:metallo-beta-lactamase family protein